MKVICIDNHPKRTGLSDNFDRQELDLTLGKTYDVIQTSPELYLIKDDSGDRCWYNKAAVIPIEEWREKRLREIGIS